ncbi:DUF3658 domain-containing protein [Lentilactobacillus hilgardii]|nr:DUF3658 domain-containing protein [Lentilactobacillus hilgardii]KRK58343.1 hypothetical protein FD42_GL001675 [Lentilactobacillus hilgardii DSM 20176 = ATCC 8290]TDG81795.1 hypothetical protein C5L34_001616 [Lentilactobacillus hilgardii]
MVDIVFNDSFARTLKRYYMTHRIDRQVIVLPLLLGLGDIAQVNLLETRKTLLKIRNTHERRDDTDEWYQSILLGLKKLDKVVFEQKSLRIWWTDLPDDSCGFAWLCDYLKDIGNQISSVHVPLTLSHSRFLYELNNLGELVTDDLNKYHLFDYEQSLGRDARISHSYLWRDLRKDNTPLRIMINGHLMSQPINFYDRFLLSHVSPTVFTNILQVIGQTIGDGPSGVPDWWYRHRIDYLISKRALWYEEPVRQSAGYIKLRIK